MKMLGEKTRFLQWNTVLVYGGKTCPRIDDVKIREKKEICIVKKINC